MDVARQLLDSLDRGDALHLDRHPAPVRVAADEIDGPDVGRPLAPDEAETLAEPRRRGRERRLQLRLDALLLKLAAVAELVADVAENLADDDFETLLAPQLTDDHELERVAVLLDDRRRRHPVQRLVAARVRVDHDRAVRLEHEEPQRVRQGRAEPAAVPNLAAGDDEAHGRERYRPKRT